jgi:hypothetical protein
MPRALSPKQTINATRTKIPNRIDVQTPSKCGTLESHHSDVQGR